MRLLSLAVLLTAATLAHAAEPTVDAAKKPEGEKVLKVVCKLEKPIGSQMVKRRCYTQDQMDVDREAAVRDLQSQKSY